MYQVRAEPAALSAAAANLLLPVGAAILFLVICLSPFAIIKGCIAGAEQSAAMEVRCSDVVHQDSALSRSHVLIG